MSKIKISGYKCERCGHTWVARNKLPVVCAKCKSPYWNRKRQNRRRK